MTMRFLHVNGSVNLPDTDTVFRELATRMPALRQIPDGERGPERESFMQILESRFRAARGLIPVVRAADAAVEEIDVAQVAIADGVDPADIVWPDLGYAGHYAESWQRFQAQERDGTIAPGTRFQVQYPTALAAVSIYVVRDDALRVLPSYERALFADLDALCAIVPADRLAVQWDIPLEVGVLEMPEVFAVSDTQTLATVAADLARCIDHVPAGVPTGLHLCYGDAGHRHWKEPESLGTQVDIVNAVTERANRPLDWAAFTVPQYAQGADFFAPLARLTPALAEPYLALVPYHPADQAGGTTDAQVALVERYLGDRPWGICTECGLSGVARDELPALLDLHSTLLARYGAAPGEPA